MNLLKIKDLSFKYPHHAPVLRHLNATFTPGTISLITGRSGAGKSTLLKLMARLLPIQHGMVYYGPRLLPQIPSRRLSNYVAMLFQDPNRQFAMRTVKHELIFTLENRCVPVNEIAGRVDRILGTNHLMKFKNRQLDTLSGGEKQRVALAIITALNSSVILLDEPFTNVDHDSRIKLMRKLVELKHRNKIIIVVDHDLQDYSEVTDQLLIMRNGQLKPVSFTQFKSSRSNEDHWQLPKSDEEPAFKLSHFSVGYQRPLIHLQQLNLFAHHATLITGPNGAGKSTLFKALLKLIRHHGHITYANQPINQIKGHRYYRIVNLVFQEPTDQFLEITVREELTLSLKGHERLGQTKQQLAKWLKVTGLDRHLNQVVYSLSGGQQRSLQLIEALLSNAPVMLMDEPFQSLDHQLIRFFKDLLRAAVKERRRTLIVISHQVAPVADLFDYHLELKNGRLRYLRGLTK